MTRISSSAVLAVAALATVVAVTPQVADAGRGGGRGGGGGFRGGGGGFRSGGGGSFRGASAPTSIGSAGARASTSGATFARSGNTYARGGNTYARGGNTYARSGNTYVAGGNRYYGGGYRGYSGGYHGYRNVNVNVNNGWGCCGGWYGHPVAAGAAVGLAAGVTAAAIGSRTYALPSTCVQEGGYFRCGDTWYQPQYAGSSVTYVAVSPPR